MARTAAKIALSDQEAQALKKRINSGLTEQRMVTRSRIVLLASEGKTNKEIAIELRLEENTVMLWRNRFRWHRLEGLNDAKGKGRKMKYTYQDRIQVIKAACEKVDNERHRTYRELEEHLSKQSGISRSQINRMLNDLDLKPHQMEYWLTSHDPEFEKKEASICGLYLDPPLNSIVICIDEKTGIQALGRENPDKPLESSRRIKREFEYVRHGTASMFAAFIVESGIVFGSVRDRHTRVEFIDFLDQIGKITPKDKRVHLIVDNLSTHKTKEVQDWLRRHINFAVHYTPTHASWLNQVEIWFSILGRKLLKKGIFNSREELVKALMDFIDKYNDAAKPFAWTYAAKPLAI